VCSFIPHFPHQSTYQVPSRTHKAYFNTAHIYSLQLLLLFNSIFVKTLLLKRSFCQH
jgi:hypothetical protein